MGDDMERRRQLTAAAFVARRAELGLTQEEVAARAGVVTRTVHYFEHGRWPNPRTRAMLERAVGWPSGEIARLAGPPAPFVDPQLLDRVAELSEEQRQAMFAWFRARREQEDDVEVRRRA